MNNVIFKNDFIILEDKNTIKVIVKNCKNSCNFCPASKLQPYRSFQLNSLIKYSTKELHIYGNCISNYLESLIAKIKSEFPIMKIKVFGCQCKFTQKLDVEFIQLLHPDYPQFISTVEPKEYMIPAIGNPEEVLSFAKDYKNSHPTRRITLVKTDAPDQDLEFWLDSKIEEIQKKLN